MQKIYNFRANQSKIYFYCKTKIKWNFKRESKTKLLIKQSVNISYLWSKLLTLQCHWWNAQWFFFFQHMIYSCKNRHCECSNWIWTTNFCRIIISWSWQNETAIVILRKCHETLPQFFSVHTDCYKLLVLFLPEVHNVVLYKTKFTNMQYLIRNHFIVVES